MKTSGNSPAVIRSIRVIGVQGNGDNLVTRVAFGYCPPADSPPATPPGDQFAIPGTQVVDCSFQPVMLFHRPAEYLPAWLPDPEIRNAEGGCAATCIHSRNRMDPLNTGRRWSGHLPPPSYLAQRCSTALGGERFLSRRFSSLPQC